MCENQSPRRGAAMSGKNVPVVLKTREPSVYGLTGAQKREVYRRLHEVQDTQAAGSRVGGSGSQAEGSPL